MKKYVMIMVLGLVVVVSVAYARRGSSAVFTFTNHPLAGYGDQIIEPPPEEMMGALEGTEAGSLNLFE